MNECGESLMDGVFLIFIFVILVGFIMFLMWDHDRIIEEKKSQKEIINLIKNFYDGK